MKIRYFSTMLLKKTVKGDLVAFDLFARLVVNTTFIGLRSQDIQRK
jgi:hypothetical protein